MEDLPRTPRPNRSEYYMGIAMAVRKRANCLGSRVGSVLVREDRIISTGYNGTPQHMRNCDEGGCERCANRDKFPPGLGYDVCICVHAEQNALLSAARFGIPVESAVLYTTLRPCFNCAKELVQARVHAVQYLHDWKHPDHELQHQYRLLEQKFSGGVAHIAMPDPDVAWAVSGLRVNAGV
ncbi:MAG: deoxycytidylate deaminase [Longimicrobiales bacterium]